MITVAHSHPVWLPQTQTWMYNQVRFLPQKIVSHVVCEHTENLDQFPVANVYPLREHSLPRYLWDKGLVKLALRHHSGWLLEKIREHRVDVVHSHFGHIAWRDMWACRKAGVAQVATFYGVDVNYLPSADPKWRRRYQELFDSVARVLCEGPHMASCIIALGCPPEKVSVQHLGVSLDELPFKPRRYEVGTPLKILIAASFREKKGVPYAIEALGRVRERVDLQITVVGDSAGSPASNAEKKRILNAIEEGDLRERVRMVGYLTFSGLLAEALDHHIFLSPSVTAKDGDTEGGAPVAVIEMAATGMPVISTRHCDIPEVLCHGVSGLLAEERDVSGIERYLIQLAQSPEGWEDLICAARKHVEKEFNARIQGERLAHLYHHALGR